MSRKCLTAVFLTLTLELMAQDLVHKKTKPLQEGLIYLEKFKPAEIDTIKDIWSGENKEVQFLFPTDEIVVIDRDSSNISFFYNYFAFEHEVIDEDNYQPEHVMGLVYFPKPSTLRFNFLINRQRIEDVEKNKALFIKKLNSLLETDVSPYGEIKKEDIDMINKRLRFYQQKDKEYLKKVEVPLLVFLGEHAIHTYGGQWKLKKASNRLDNNFLIPYPYIGNDEIDIYWDLYKEFYLMPIKEVNHLIDIGTIKELIRMDIKVKFRMEKQNKGFNIDKN